MLLQLSPSLPRHLNLPLRSIRGHCSLNRRKWSTHSRGLQSAPSVRSADAGYQDRIARFSILTASPANLIRRLDAPDAKLDSTSDGSPFLAILLTPPFAHLFDSRDDFLSSVASNTLQGLRSGTQVNVLAAVVDTIPINVPGSVLPPEACQERAEGTDGLSVCLMDSREGDTLWNDRTSPSLTPRNDVAGQLSFRVETPIRDGAQPSIDMLYRITLPLPNTVFQNGQLQTLKALRFEVDDNGVDQTSQMRLLRSRDLLNYTLTLKSGNLKAVAGPPAKDDTLVPLSRFRRVVDSMGNILRRLDDSGSENGQITASHELEASLRQWKERPFEIWAEIVPSEQFRKAPGDVDELPFISRLEQGHRFARVLSGGGGWGARAGLLSLDPETIPYRFSRIDAGEQPELELPFALPDLVRRGDSIRYLLAPRSLAEGFTSVDRSSHLRGTTFSLPPAFEFGSGIRQDAEDAVEFPTPAPNDAVLVASFGALSRKPAAVEINQTISRNTKTPPERHNHIVQTLLPPRATLAYA